ncbi:MAG: FAD-dependent oxidoreductase, partial [Armatimonadota bacterium]
VETQRMPPREEINRLYRAAQEQGRVVCPREDVLFFRTTREGEVHFNTTRVVRADGTRSEDLTRAEIESRRQVRQMVDFLRADVPGFEQAYLQLTGTQIGVRETRRIVGEYVLTAEDVLGARKFEDCVARGSYPIDIHDPAGGGTVIKHLPPGESYDVPYRCLVPLGIGNLLVAGRPISSTHEAHSSLRVMPIACAVGEAAGTAAALCVRFGVAPRALDTRRLQSTLIAQGANLGKRRPVEVDSGARAS